MNKNIEALLSGTSIGDNHEYLKALFIAIHHMAYFFLNLSEDRFIDRLYHMHPIVTKDKLNEALESSNLQNY